jgi:hypothetical protein
MNTAKLEDVNIQPAGFRTTRILTTDEPLVTDEPVEFENNWLKLKASGALPIILEVYRIYLK